MILLDTNIISELMKNRPDQQVISWIDQQETMTLFISSISIAEIIYGLSILAPSKRREYLQEAFNQLISRAFKQRVVFFDESAAQVYGHLMAHREALGRPLSLLDGQIAAISIANQMTLATRNTRDFLDCELSLIDPFLE